MVPREGPAASATCNALDPRAARAVPTPRVTPLEALRRQGAPGTAPSATPSKVSHSSNWHGADGPPTSGEVGASLGGRAAASVMRRSADESDAEPVEASLAAPSDAS